MDKLGPIQTNNQNMSGNVYQMSRQAIEQGKAFPMNDYYKTVRSFFKSKSKTKTVQSRKRPKNSTYEYMISVLLKLIKVRDINS